MILVFGSAIVIILVWVTLILERIEKNLKNIDFGMGKIQQVLERIEAATEEAKDEPKQ